MESCDDGAHCIKHGCTAYLSLSDAMLWVHYIFPAPKEINLQEARAGSVCCTRHQEFMLQCERAASGGP